MAQTILHFHKTTTATPEQFVGGLTAFGPGRSKLFSNSADEYLKVHNVGRSQADVTEGSHGIWERLHYDWSDPHRVVIDTIDSNAWGARPGTATSSPVCPMAPQILTWLSHAKARASQDCC